jgi:hypothetical protein
MASQKRSLSNASEADGGTKMPKLSQNENSAPEPPPEDRFIIEVKLRSTSKATANDNYSRPTWKEVMAQMKDNPTSDGAPPAASAGPTGDTSVGDTDDKPREVEDLNLDQPNLS